MINIDPVVEVSKNPAQPSRAVFQNAAVDIPNLHFYPQDENPPQVAMIWQGLFRAGGGARIYTLINQT